MKKILCLLPLLLLLGCSKDENHLNGTKWISTNSAECWWENHTLDGHYSERLSFSSKTMRSQTLKDGSVYRNNWTRDYTIEDNVITDEAGTNYYLYDDVMYQGTYVFYKE